MAMRTNKEIKTTHVHIKEPSRGKPGGQSVIGHYWTEDGFVIMCSPNGTPVEINGRRFRQKFGTESGELSEREVASMLTLEIKRELKGGNQPCRVSAGFGGPIPYPRAY